jgi:hypothetical protein
MVTMSVEEFRKMQAETGKRLEPWRQARKEAFERFVKEEIPKIYGNSELEPDGRTTGMGEPHIGG